MNSDVLTLGQAAARVGVSADRLRKAWKTWRTQTAFPAPLKAPPHGRYAWDREDLEAWVSARKRALGQAQPAAFTPEPLDHDLGRLPPAAQRVARDRADLALLMRRA